MFVESDRRCAVVFFGLCGYLLGDFGLRGLSLFKVGALANMWQRDGGWLAGPLECFCAARPEPVEGFFGC